MKAPDRNPSGISCEGEANCAARENGGRDAEQSNVHFKGHVSADYGWPNRQHAVGIVVFAVIKGLCEYGRKKPCVGGRRQRRCYPQPLHHKIARPPYKHQCDQANADVACDLPNDMKSRVTDPSRICRVRFIQIEHGWNCAVPQSTQGQQNLGEHDRHHWSPWNSLPSRAPANNRFVLLFAQRYSYTAVRAE